MAINISCDPPPPPQWCQPSLGNDCISTYHNLSEIISTIVCPLSFGDKHVSLNVSGGTGMCVCVCAGNASTSYCLKLISLHLLRHLHLSGNICTLVPEPLFSLNVHLKSTS